MSSCSTVTTRASADWCRHGFTATRRSTSGSSWSRRHRTDKSAPPPVRSNQLLRVSHQRVSHQIGGPMLRIREVAQPDAAAAAEVRRPSAAASAAAASAEIIRDFDDPYLELVRLLREAAEIEHALMVQYLYGAYSLKPAYIGIRGFSAPSPNHLLGVAIQEMQHLEK